VTGTAETAKTAQDTALADVNLAASDVAVARTTISDAKAQLQQESATLDFHTLAAPYDAMVTARTKELGSALGTGEPVFTLIDPKSVWVLAFIDESKAGEIAVDEPAEIVLRSRPNRARKFKELLSLVALLEPSNVCFRRWLFVLRLGFLS
jgi:HlyD family secretion protein